MELSVIFDMDGVIIDSEPVYLKFDCNFFNHIGINITDDIKKTFPGSQFKQIIKYVLENTETKFTYEEVLDLYINYRNNNFEIDFSAILNKEIIALYF